MIGRSTDAALLNLMVSHEQLDRAVQMGCRPRGEDPGAHGRADHAAFRKHIDPDGLSIVKAGDFKAAGVWLRSVRLQPGLGHRMRQPVRIGGEKTDENPQAPAARSDVRAIAA